MGFLPISVSIFSQTKKNATYTLYKNSFYKNHEAQISKKFKNFLRIMIIIIQLNSKIIYFEHIILESFEAQNPKCLIARFGKKSMILIIIKKKVCIASNKRPTSRKRLLRINGSFLKGKNLRKKKTKVI